MIEILDSAGWVRVSIRVQPRASRNEIAGEWDGALRIRLTAPPVDDRANEALRDLLAERLKVSASAVNIVTGEHSRIKHVEIRGVSAAQVRALAAAAAKQTRSSTKKRAGK